MEIINAIIKDNDLCSLKYIAMQVNKQRDSYDKHEKIKHNDEFGFYYTYCF